MKKRILGIDPGSCITGFGILEVDGQNMTCITGGCIRLRGTTSEKLGGLLEHLGKLIESHGPTEVAIEDIFFHENAQSALKLGQARGVALAVVMKYGLPVFPYTARQVKLAVVGKGSADKTQIQYMVSYLLKLEHGLQADTADALAVALCHAHIQMGWGGMIREQTLSGFSRKRTARKRNYKWPSYQK